MDLFFSLITDFIFISLFDDGKLLGVIHESNHCMHSENFVSKLRKILDENELILKDITNIFFITGPGSQTGERVSLSFAITMQSLNSKVKIFLMSSLDFQVGLEKSFLSVISVGQNTKKYHLKACLNGNVFLKKDGISEVEVDEIKAKFADLSFFFNFKDFSFLDTFLLLKDKFSVFEGVY